MGDSIAKHATVNCSLGTFKVQSIVTMKAFCAFVSKAKDEKAAFRALLDVAVLEPKPLPRDLSDDDLNVLAKFYADSLGVSQQYKVARQTQTVESSFLSALQQSDSWKRLQSMFTDLAREIGVIVPEVSRQLKKASSEIRQTFEVPRGLSVSIARSGQLRLSAERCALMKLSIDESLVRSLQDASRAWQEMMTDLATPLQIIRESIQQHAQQLVEIASQFSLYQQTASQAIVELAETWRSRRFQDFAWEPISRSIALSDDVVARTNGFFSANRLLGEQALREREDLSAALSVDAQSQCVVHRGASRILANSSMLALEGRDLLAEMDQMLDRKLQPFQPILERLTMLAKPGGFHHCLADFAKEFQRDHWRSLWQEPGDSYKPSPEAIAKAVLGMFLHGMWKGVAFVGQELRNGDGFVDLLVHFLGKDYIVEIKIIGGSWPFGWAESGLGQLDDYMANYSTPEAYLVVFDGRKTARGNQFEPKYKVKGCIPEKWSLCAHLNMFFFLEL